MSKWICKTEKCKKPCYAEPPEHCRPIRCLLKANVKPKWQEVTEPTTNGSQLPKLTVEVFDRPDCPEWAKYASVNKDGFVIFYEEGTSLGARKESIGIFDNSDWQNSLIERPEKKETLPDWCKVGELGYNPSRGFYFEIVEISDNHIEVKYPHITNECYRLTIEYFKKCNPSQARIRPYNTEEMQGLVGKIIENDKYVHFINTFNKDLMEAVSGIDGYTAKDLLDLDYNVDGKLCGKFEHIENGKWVE